LPLSAFRWHQALHEYEPRDRQEHGQEDRKDEVERGC
jgi:hypothetical protein